jgi:single-stranded-DNA-specific exonuclease
VNLQPQWILPPVVETSRVRELAAELRIAPIVAEILLRRGFDQPDAGIDDFLRPRLKRLSDPFELPDMGPAIQRVLHTVQKRRRIVLYGDYDVDGVTSLAILCRVLRAFQAKVECFLPRRVGEGYGLSAAGIERCLEDHQPDLLIAVDCGTCSVQEIRQLRERGIEVIVLDHHEALETLPACTGVINPKRIGRFEYLCSAGLVFKFCHALLKTQPDVEVDLKDYLDLVALGTVADISPLVDENRILVRAGLQRVTQTRWAGLRALMEVARVEPPVSVKDLGFRLGPRLNAAGRLGTAQTALDLLLTDNPMEARRLAQELDRQNTARQNVELRIYEEALAQAHQQMAGTGDAGNGEGKGNGDSTASPRHSIVVGKEDWHPGVLGIVAARIMHQFYRPTVVVGFDDAGQGKGSGRSTEGLMLVDALSRCGELLTNFGGHAAAAGVTLPRENLDSFRKAFETSARELMPRGALCPVLRLDAGIALDDLLPPLLEEYSFLEPFGMGNPRPVLFLRQVTPAKPPVLMKEKHLRLEFGSRRHSVRGVFFNSPRPEELPRPPWDVAFYLEANHYRGQTNLQLTVQAIRQSR